MNFSMSEIIVVAVIALFVVKPDHLPHAARAAGRALRTVRRLTNKIQTMIEETANK